MLNFPNGFAGGGGAVQLQRDDRADHRWRGSANHQRRGGHGSERLCLDSGQCDEFTTQFSISQLPGTATTADGMTFTIQGVAATAVGGTGGGLGFAGTTKSVAIKFDLYDNAGEGPNSTGLYMNGVQPNAVNSINLAGTGIDLHSGHAFNVSMSYNGTTLTVTITDTVTLATATQNYTVDIPTIVGGNTAFVGFTGGTGGLTAVQQVLNWTYSNTTIPAAPTAPTGLLVSSSSATQVSLGWTNTDPTATAVLIERQDGPGGNLCSDWDSGQSC